MSLTRGEPCQIPEAIRNIKGVCPVCRKSYKISPYDRTKTCCEGYILVKFYDKVRVPKPNQIHKWKKVIRLFLFNHIPFYCDGNFYCKWKEIKQQEKESIIRLLQGLDMKDEFIDLLEEERRKYYEMKVQRKREHYKFKKKYPYLF